MKRMVGRRIVDDEAKTAALVTVHRSWWRSDRYYVDDTSQITTNVLAGGGLIIRVVEADTYYSHGSWTKMSRKMIHSKAKV